MSVIDLSTLLLFFIWFFLFIKALLKICYLIQLKEYRWDRIKAFLKTYSGKRFFLPTRYFLRPITTIRIALVLLFTFSLGFFVSLFLYFTFLDYKAFLTGLLLSYILLPLLVVISLGLFYPFEFLMKKMIVLLAKRKINSFKDLLVIGITGSFGKTSTKEILATILQAKYKVCKTKGTNNTPLGVARTIHKDLKKDHQIFIAEMGAYKIGEIRQICQLVNPKIGIVTGINEQHLELFGSLENTVKAKSELIESLPKDGLVVLNIANKYTREMAKNAKCKVAFFGKEKKKFKISLIDDHYQLNIQAALQVANYLGVSQKKALEQIKKIKPFAQTFKIKKEKNEVVTIDDSYNSNPDGFRNALKLIDKFKNKKKIVITPGIIELGQASDQIHQGLGQKIAQLADWLILTNKDFYQPLLKGIKQSRKKTKVDILSKATLDKLKKARKKGNVLILLEGRMPVAVRKVFQDV